MLRERLKVLRSIRERQESSPEDETIHPDTWLPHEEHIRYVRTVRYDDALLCRREMPHVDKQVYVLGQIWGFPDLIDPPVKNRHRTSGLPKLSYSQLYRLSVLCSEDQFSSPDGILVDVYLRSLCALGLVTLSERRNWREVLRSGLGLVPRELPRSSELERFRRLYPDHSDVFASDVEGYHRVFSVMVPSGRVAVEYMTAAVIGLRSAIRDTEANLDLPEESRLRLVRSLSSSDPGISVRKLARAFSVPVRAIGGA
jgi:hypothetical protein